MKYQELISQMTLVEKASLLVGKDLWNTHEIQRLGIPSIRMSDGPHGLRVELYDNRKDYEYKSKVAVCFPAEATIANSWNTDIAHQIGKAIGEEAVDSNVQIVLGPGVNIKRSPLCGRNFEYFSEDPYLSGKMGAAYVKGIQENGVAACVKHFAANNQEENRLLIDVVIDERTLREIYLSAFQMIVEEANPASIMSAYNKINGTYCSENKILLDILKTEWNFDGIVITDWGAENDRVEALKAGNEIEMPGDRENIIEQITTAVENHEISEELIDSLLDRILTLIFQLQNQKPICCSLKEHHEIALKAAQDSVVLLQNKDNFFPIRNKKNIAIIGDMATYPRYQGSGSSKVNPYKIDSVYNSLKHASIEFSFAQGYTRVEDENKEELLQEAIQMAKENEIVLLFVGLTENEESEGRDRKTLSLSPNQNRLIEEICKVNANVGIILSHGSPVTMPWKDNVKTILTGYLGGEAGAQAIVDCIFGVINPSGKLAETYPLKLEDTPCYKNFPGTDVTVEYQESLYVGYRYYDKVSKEVLFPFGYGLSYTTFHYSHLQIEQNNTDVTVSFLLKNTGKVKGKEIVQLYVSQENSRIFKVKKELKAFEKIELEPNEEKLVTLLLDKKAFQYYNVETSKWSVEEGTYKILIGSSSQEILLEEFIQIQSLDEKTHQEYPSVYQTGHIHDIQDSDFEQLLGKNIPSRKVSIKDITEANSIEQMKSTRMGNYLYTKQIERMHRLLEEQETYKASKVLEYLQKPLKKMYEEQNSPISRKMVTQFIEFAKKDAEDYSCEFVKIYLNDYANI